MVTLRRKKTETITGYFYTGQTHNLVIGQVEAAAGDFIAVDESGEPSAVIPAEYVREHFVPVPKRGRPVKDSESGELSDDRQGEIPGT
jgi:hypothetical protein